MHDIPAVDRRFYPIYAKCVEIDIPCVLTAGSAFRMPGVVVDDAAPRHIDRVATEFPELKLVVSHGGYPYGRELVATACRHRNVNFVRSGVELLPWADESVEGANELVHDKALFASAFPFFTFDTMIERCAKLPIKPDMRPMVMGLNVARLLGIEP